MEARGCEASFHGEGRESFPSDCPHPRSPRGKVGGRTGSERQREYKCRALLKRGIWLGLKHRVDIHLMGQWGLTLRSDVRAQRRRGLEGWP